MICIIEIATHIYQIIVGLYIILMKQEGNKMQCYPCQFVGRHKVNSLFLLLDRSFGIAYLKRLENKKQDIHFVIPSQFI